MFWLGSVWMFFITSHILVLCKTKHAIVYKLVVFQYISCFGSMEIETTLQAISTKFQYISCFGSIRIFTALYFIIIQYNSLKFNYLDFFTNLMLLLSKNARML